MDQPFPHPIGHVSGPGAPHPVLLFVDDEGRLALTCTVDGHGWRLPDAVASVPGSRPQAHPAPQGQDHGSSEDVLVHVPPSDAAGAHAGPVDAVAVARALLRS